MLAMYRDMPSDVVRIRPRYLMCYRLSTVKKNCMPPYKSTLDFEGINLSKLSRLICEYIWYGTLNMAFVINVTRQTG